MLLRDGFEPANLRFSCPFDSPTDTQRSKNTSLTKVESRSMKFPMLQIVIIAKVPLNDHFICELGWKKIGSY